LRCQLEQAGHVAVRAPSKQKTLELDKDAYYATWTNNSNNNNNNKATNSKSSQIKS
jgi:hypothetical protein